MPSGRSKDENPPAFEIIESTWREQAGNTRASIAAERDWNRTITWLSFPDDQRGGKRFEVTATAGDFLAQLSLHEVHHRAQVMAMLRTLPGAGGRPVQDIDYNALMFERREVA